jgi:hypothetical protein
MQLLRDMNGKGNLIIKRFEGFDWDALYEKKLPTPYQPDKSKVLSEKDSEI